MADNPETPTRFAALAARAREFFIWLWNGRGPRKPWVRRTLVVLFVLIVPLPVFLILLFRFVPPPTTPLMLSTAIFDGSADQRWVPLEQISPYLVKAVIGAEDEQFCFHNGFDWEAIDTAMRHNERSRRLWGGSTISQQTAKNLFLLPTRTWVRKGAEAYLTVLIEALWPKRRILETYLNIIEWGHRRFGAEAASRGYFGKPAARLDAGEAARLAAVLPDPNRWRVDSPGPYVSQRGDDIIARMAEVSRDGLDACIGH